MKMAKSVEEYFEMNADWTDALDKLRGLLLRTELNEELKWGAPYYTLNKKHVVGIAAFKQYVGLWFINGVFLVDEGKFLVNAGENQTKGLRQWRFNSVDEIDEDLVYAYILEAIENQKLGKEIKPQRKPLIIPEKLNQALNTDENLKLAFDALSRGKQIEYADHIGSAKQDATRINRLRKCVPMILKGIGLNDKYR